jgi:hypothetical protein
MAYIGKQPSTKFSAAAKLDSFTGDGSTTTFDLTNVVPAGGENGLQVFVDNVRQKPGSSNAYSLGNDGSGDLKRITFTAAPDSGAEIYVITTYEATNIKNVPDGTITNEKIADGAIDNAAVSPSAAISDTKLGTISTACKVATSAISQPGSSGVYLAGDGNWGAIDTSAIDTNAFNISLLGFKMAVNEGLTVFNLVDGVVDEFNDESGTDEAEGSNDLYCATSDYYINNTSPDGSCVPISAGFSMTAITEPDTSTTGTNPTHGTGTMGQFTVPTGMTSLNVSVWGSGGASGEGCGPTTTGGPGGGGGYSSGTLEVTASQTLYISAGEGGARGDPYGNINAFINGGQVFQSGNPTAVNIGGGGGLSGVFGADLVPLPYACLSAPQAFVIAGSGGGGGDGYTTSPTETGDGGAGGGLTGDVAGHPRSEQTASDNNNGGGGDQEQGGQGGPGITFAGQNGDLFYGGGDQPAVGHTGGGGAGYYGGGAGGRGHPCSPGYDGSGGGGSSYYGHPQITSGSTEEGSGFEGGGVAIPSYVADTNEGGIRPPYPSGNLPLCHTSQGEEGYVLLTGCVAGAVTSTTVVSTAFTSTSVPTSARIVVFEENVDTPTLNTDIVASISRDGGTTFTNATLTDSGYVTGSSGQRILTGQATISGQPSGQSMRWKLALANNTVKIHGVSLQWA